MQSGKHRRAGRRAAAARAHRQGEHADRVFDAAGGAPEAGGRYRLQLSDFYNMSYLQSNASFGAAGGVDGPSNRFDIYGVRLLRMR